MGADKAGMMFSPGVTGSHAMTAYRAIEEIWSGLGLPAVAATITGTDPVLASSFRVGAAAAASIAASGMAAAALWQLRTGRAQAVSVEMRHACAAFQSERHVMLEGRAVPDPTSPVAGLYPAGDGRFVRLHTNFPHHEAGVLRLLGCEATREAVAAALRAWSAFDFEAAAAAAGLAVTACRSFAEWDAHPQGMAVPALPLVRIEQIGAAPPEGLPHSATPLGGVRVLELTRVIAGPVGGRTLAAHGAEVLNLTGPGLPSYRIEDLGRGKRSAQLDLRSGAGREAMAGLLRGADVFVQGYRPGAVAGLGFSPDVAVALRPGLVCASLSAYGAAGPWAGRRGFDSLVQTASGFNLAEAAAAGEVKPRPLPAQALDHATGYLLAAGIMAALYRRATVGGSWHVSVSLARTGWWLRGLPRVADGFGVPPLDIAGFTEESDSGFGRMTAIAHPAGLSETPARWELPSMPLGSHPPRWSA